MKEYRVYYKKYGLEFERVVYKDVEAFCEEDAINWFFNNVGGCLVRVELVESLQWI